ncbi:MAG TPA: GntR family transcriptional regulator [Allosphingosinicella sp.]|jgi:DNA-binding GntR family transcriptional regulator
MHLGTRTQLPALAKAEFRTGAVDSLRTIIVSGGLRPGERLVESEIADRLGISRTPVREAFFHLRRDGLICGGEGRGLFVAPLSVREITEIYQLLGGLERIALRHIAKVSPATLSQLKKASAKRLRAGSDIGAIIDADRKWHEALTAQSSNLRALDLMSGPRALAERYERAFFRAEANQERSVREHREIEALVEAGDLRGAADLIEDHWLDNIPPMAAAIAGSGAASR